MPPLPSAARAALGFAATVFDQAKTLPDKAIELPMLAVSKTLQFSMRAQRGYAAMTARGDEILASRQITDEAPQWATFDEPVDADAEAAAVVADALEADALEADDETIADETRARPAKTVRAPRNGAPSAFDTVADE